MKSEKGFSLIEVVIAIALVGIIAIAFLGGLANASKTLFIADERATANNLAESQMESVKNRPYAISYDPAPIPSEYSGTGYSAEIDVESLEDGNIQKITVTIEHYGSEAAILGGYKVK